MAFFSARCPACKKDIQVPDDIDISICMYCGKSIVVKQVIQVTFGPKITNLLGLARTADIAGNLTEAETYYTRVLELDPAIWEAWIGKGKSAGWQSSLANMRFGEVLTSFQHAIGTTPEHEKRETISSCVSEVNRLVIALYEIAREHMLQHVALPDTWGDYLDRIEQMLETLETANTWCSTDETTLNNIVLLCRDNIEGVSYNDPYDRNRRKIKSLSLEYEALLRKKLNTAADELKAIDPSYAPPAINKNKLDYCFVVTATMGDEYHPTVDLMRRFRDQWILARPGGKAFISLYYRYGPLAANIIRGSRLLRAISLVIIVTPAAWLASRLVK